MRAITLGFDTPGFAFSIVVIDRLRCFDVLEPVASATRAILDYLGLGAVVGRLDDGGMVPVPSAILAEPGHSGSRI
jgi:hypothetical protein